MNRVVVTGIGMVSPLASNVNDTWNQLLQSKSGINRITSFNTDDLNVKIAGQIPSSEEKFGLNADNFVEPKDQRKIDDFILYAIAAADQAIKDSKIGKLDEENSKKVTNAFEILLSRYNSTIVIATHSKKLAQNLNAKLIIKNKKINKI